MFFVRILSMIFLTVRIEAVVDWFLAQTILDSPSIFLKFWLDTIEEEMITETSAYIQGIEAVYMTGHQ